MPLPPKPSQRTVKMCRNRGLAVKEVNVTALRQNLPNYLALVERGETVRGRVIAEITPPA